MGFFKPSSFGAEAGFLFFFFVSTSKALAPALKNRCDTSSLLGRGKEPLTSGAWEWGYGHQPDQVSFDHHVL